MALQLIYTAKGAEALEIKWFAQEIPHITKNHSLHRKKLCYHVIKHSYPMRMAVFSILNGGNNMVLTLKWR